MGINVKQLREFVIVPTLIAMGKHSEEAVDLLLMTAAVESNMGTFLKQVGGGPALGIYQMEPDTHSDIWENYLQFRKGLMSTIDELFIPCDSATVYDEELNIPIVNPNEMMGNLNYATAMARVHYLRVAESLPSKAELSEKEYVIQLASYWKSYYNTPLGAGTVEKAMEAYLTYVVNG